MTSYTRAEKRRMMRDPLRVHKAIVGDLNHKEWNRLYSHGIILLAELADLHMQISGLLWTPEAFRDDKSVRLAERFREVQGELEVIRDRMKEIEDAEKNSKPE